MTAHVPVPSIWTDDRVELLVKLNADGLSRSQIAAMLDCPGITRNSVIGKLHRLGVDPPTRQKPRYKPSSRAPRKSKPRLVSPIKTFALPPDPTLEEFNRDIPFAQRLTLAELTDKTCKFPCGDPGEPNFFFCGGKPKKGQPYCNFHHRVAHQKPQPRGHFRQRGWGA